jgi:hypothetical protein
VPGAASPVWYIPTAPEESRETFLEIRLAGGASDLLTVIEFLTPANKTPQSVVREQYLSHRREVLAAGAHLLELDLLRGGEHTVLAPRTRILRRGRYDYLACLSRAGGREFCDVWGIPLREPLPRLAVPLIDEPDLLLDLQSLFTRCFEEGGFGRQLDYSRDPFHPLPPADARWAEEVLRGVTREKG